jgi:uncharacterized protein
MGPLSSREVEGFDLEHALIAGLLPPHFLSDDPIADLRAYVADYLKEEIAIEARAKDLPAFAEFLRVAALTNAELLNVANVGRECGVSAKVVRGYFEILEDTMLGFRLRPWTRSSKRRAILTEKLYFLDVGVSNFLARRRPQPGSAEFGKSFEHYVLEEILSYRRYVEPEMDVSFWRTASGYEVDFILGDMLAAIEVKAGRRVHDADLRGLIALGEERAAKVKRKIVVCDEREPRRVRDVEILPWREFLDRLFDGELTA